MGVYSNAAARLMKEQEVPHDPNAAGLLEFAINSQMAEQKMFESMIEMDILDYRCESGTIILSEEQKEDGAGNVIKNIGKKIVAAIEKFIQTLEVFIDKIKNLVLEKTKIDKKLIEKYGKNIDLAKAKANKPDKEVTIADISKLGKLNIFINSTGAQSLSAIKGNTEVTEDMANALGENLKANVSDEVFNSVFTKKKIADLTDAEVQGMIDNVSGGYQKIVEDIIGKAAKDSLKTAKEARKEALKTAVGNKDERAKMSQVFKFTSAANSAISKGINFGSNIAAKVMADSRNGFVAVALAANKAAKAEDKKVKQEAAELDYNDCLEFALECATDNIYADFTVG